jgi:hypothetical protein
LDAGAYRNPHSRRTGAAVRNAAAKAAEHLKLRTWLALATVLALIAFAVYEAAIAVRLWRVLPFMDQWETVSLYQSVMNHPWSIPWLLFQEHNEHRLPLTKLAFLVDFTWFDARSTFVLPLLLMLHVMLGAALGLVASRHLPASERLVAVMLGVAFLLSPLQIENLAHPFHSQWALCGLFSLVAFYSTARLAEAEEHHGLHIVLAVLSTVGAVYSSANGLASAFIVFLLTCVLPLPRFARVAVAGAAILSVATFFIGYDFAPHHVPYHASFRSWHGLAKFALYICAFFGCIADYGGLISAIAVGAVGLSLWVALTTSGIIQFYRRKTVDAAAVALLALATASVATALMTAFGRGSLSLDQALSSRYSTWVLPFWFALTASAANTFANSFRDAKLVALAFLILVLVASLISAQSPIEWHRQRVAAMDMIAAQALAGRTPDHLELIYPVPTVVLPRLEFLRQHRLSIFSAGHD